MSERRQGTADFSPLRMWTDLVSGLMTAGTCFSPEAMPPDMLRQMRSGWLQAWADFWESYSRSPQFLEMMKETFNSSLGMRKQFNRYLGEMHHQFQGVSRQDVDELMDTIQHLEQRLVDESERITRRLDDLRRRVDQLQDSVQGQHHPNGRRERSRTRSEEEPE